MIKCFTQYAALFAVCLFATGTPAALHLRLDHADPDAHHGCNHPCEPTDQPGEPHEGCAVCSAIAHLQADTLDLGVAAFCFDLHECDRVTTIASRIVCQFQAKTAARGPPAC